MDEQVIQLLNRSVCEITERVGGIKLTPTDKMEQMVDCGTLLLYIDGDYKAVLALSVEHTVMREITGNMKHKAPVQKEDIPIYMAEYYNILCGYFVSHYNQRYKKKARFGIPEFSEGIMRVEKAGYDNYLILEYQCALGRIQLQCAGIPSADAVNI